MKEEIYYCRDSQKRPLITVCLLKDEDGNVARGVSICSPRDNPSKAEGRMLAVGRAHEAMGLRCNKSFMNRKEVTGWTGVLRATGTTFTFGNHPLYKINFNPTLSEFEQKLLRCES